LLTKSGDKMRISHTEPTNKKETSCTPVYHNAVIASYTMSLRR
jgi:hypothetical protein